jgi:peptidyl-prolyl cis-trans isomerase A (cyclophilin A)
MMSRWTFCLFLVSVCFVMGDRSLLAGDVQTKEATAKDQPAPKIKDFGKAPKTFRVKFETSVGNFVMEVHRDWSPNGADRFYNLVNNKFYDECRFFRVLEGFMAQTGINGNPAVQALWRNKTFKDDPVIESNTRGYVTFAKSGLPNSRSTQLFINYGNNSRLDRSGFSPFAKVVQGMDVVDDLYPLYGEGFPGGRGPSQGKIQAEGNVYLKKGFPKLDYIKKATIVKAASEQKK